MNHRVGEGLSLTDAEWSAWRKWATSCTSSAEGAQDFFLPFLWCSDTSMWAWMRSLSVVRCSCVHRRIAEVAALVVDSCSGMRLAGFTGFAPLVVFLSSAVRPTMLGMNQKGSCAV